jgi:hypothetical protein
MKWFKRDDDVIDSLIKQPKPLHVGYDQAQAESVIRKQQHADRRQRRHAQAIVQDVQTRATLKAPIYLRKKA